MRKNSVLHILMGVGFALCLVCILVFGLAALIWSGTLPSTTPGIALGFFMGLCSFAGGRVAIGKGNDPILTGLSVGAVMSCVLALICLAATGEIPLHGKFLSMVLLTLAGGGVSGLFGGKKKTKKKKKK